MHAFHHATILSRSFHGLSKEGLAQWPPFMSSTQQKRVQIIRLADYTSKTNYNNMPETQNPLAKTFFVMLKSRNEWQGLFQVVVNGEWNSLFLFHEIFLKVPSLICVSIVIAAGEKLNQHAMWMFHTP